MIRTIQLIIIGIVIILFPSCYNSKKATEQVNKANEKYPAVVAKLARDIYPCTEVLKPDTLTTVKDSIIYVDVECPDTTTNTNDFGVVITKTDTVHNTVTKTIRVPVKVQVRTEYITKYFEDSAKLKLNSIDLNNCNTANEKLQASNGSLTKKVARKTKENWIWRIIALCLIAWQVFKIYKRITTIKVT